MATRTTFPSSVWIQLFGSTPSGLVDPKYMSKEPSGLDGGVSNWLRKGKGWPVWGIVPSTGL